jgi:tRNA A-37 threonylcarbamoyl transferase component Bud32
MFNPTLDTRLVIDGQEYTFSPHPVVPTLVWGQEGRHAIVYRLQNNGDAFALKVFRPAFRHPGLVEAADALWTYHELPGMRVCRQTVILQETHPALVDRYEDLDYAIVMPWIEGQTWFDFLSKRERVSLDQSRALAESVTWVLYALELNHLAHCDLSSGNVIIDPELDRIHLIDVEDLYSPWLASPPYVPAGSMGYQHQDVVKSGQWGPLGDRFAGAVLMAEMLGWAHPDVRKRAWGESYFAPEELQCDSERYEVLCEALRIYDPGFAEAFEQAWRSRTLESCPPLKTWYDLLDALPRDPVASWAPIDPGQFEEPTPRPEGVRVAGDGGDYALTRRERWRLEREQKQNGRKGCARGCRRVAIITLVLSLLACYAAFLAVEWSLLNDIF